MRPGCISWVIKVTVLWNRSWGLWCEGVYW